MQPPAGAYGHPPPPHGQPMMPNGAPAPPSDLRISPAAWFGRRSMLVFTPRPGAERRSRRVRPARATRTGLPSRSRSTEDPRLTPDHPLPGLPRTQPARLRTRARPVPRPKTCRAR